MAKAEEGREGGGKLHKFFSTFFMTKVGEEARRKMGRKEEEEVVS